VRPASGRAEPKNQCLPLVSEAEYHSGFKPLASRNSQEAFGPMEGVFSQLLVYQMVYRMVGQLLADFMEVVAERVDSKPTVRIDHATVFVTAPSQMGIGSRVNSRWLQAPATNFLSIYIIQLGWSCVALAFPVRHWGRHRVATPSSLLRSRSKASLTAQSPDPIADYAFLLAATRRVCLFLLHRNWGKARLRRHCMTRISFRYPIVGRARRRARSLQAWQVVGPGDPGRSAHVECIR
jgi:hypothetical protein